MFQEFGANKYLDRFLADSCKIMKQVVFILRGNIGDHLGH